jgi:cytochrome c oxidase subunit 4
MSHEHAEIDSHVRTYIMVFASLMVLTILTVGAWHFGHKWEISHAATITIALIIATIKASLVACFFMHLLTEKKLVLGIMVLTVAFFFVLLFLPVFTSIANQVGG